MTFEHGKSTTVKTQKGLLRGFKYNDVYHFYGVKYANAERFMPPVEVEPWEGVKEATNYGYICPNVQYNRIGTNVKNPHRFWPESEHCQYLNIWTKSIDANNKKPVLVWFHGGGFFDGSSLEHETYDGYSLCDIGDVVVVTLNHRLSVWGYLDLSDYGEQFKRSKNVGNLDLIAALQWVNKNIEYFGGDKDNVTLFGQSGGGIKVISVMNMPASKGLFKRGFVMSGLEGTKSFSRHNVDNRDLVKRTLDKLGITKDNIQDLVEMNGRRILDTYIATSKELGGKGIPFFAPTRNEDYIGNPITFGFSEHAKAAPLIVGSNFSEFLLLPKKYDRSSMNEEQMRNAVACELKVDNPDYLIALFNKAFPKDHKTIDILTYDCCCIRPDVYEFCKARLDAGCRETYNYMFAPVFKLNDGFTASHSTDIAFIFNNIHMVPSTDLDGQELDLQYEMVGRLLAFANNDNPQLEGKDVWHPVTQDAFPTMVFDRETHEKVDFDKELIDELGKLKTFTLVVG
ncbi:MAG: carboxylesterase/lipase family protein [Erysipelotrichaceae bacterium]|nr:carboxylesterase/lipase family protein [Erysipelotrichaceae bacterium]